MLPRLLCLLAVAICAPVAWGQRKVDVADDVALRRALAEAQPGWQIVIAPGKYQSGISARGLAGTKDQPIVIEAADPKNKPVIEGGRLGLHLSDCSHLVLRNITVRGQSGNGINIDDGGSFDTPAHHITLEGVDVYEIGPTGNRDGIKLSGVDDLVLRNCLLEGWAGQGIDMVGCHRGLIENCTFRGKPGFAQQIAVQAKGGSADVTVRTCTFLNAGQRGVNLGGSTSPRVFRPQGARYEAKDITVEGCRFVGGMAPVAFVGVDGAVVRYNTIHQPDKWVVRILQENTAAEMTPSRAGRFERNLVVFNAQVGRTAANIGPRTDPASFVFRENLWYCADQPARSRVDLPTREQAGVYGTDPKVKMTDSGVPGAPAAEAARGYGADALPKP